MGPCRAVPAAAPPEVRFAQPPIADAEAPEVRFVPPRVQPSHSQAGIPCFLASVFPSIDSLVDSDEFAVLSVTIDGLSGGWKELVCGNN
ncbi:hypothetical protein AVEN_70791-1 [Araneus ventricosus]|uniref:Uncharacterized protein n=1 Tax=Araneus ventricosus TaxID=182803 RepID=A0A4Y2QVD7_ARAVE|nr:hypothetical protein AVEN_70791-1 [Araneus ventricosus]